MPKQLHRPSTPTFLSRNDENESFDDGDDPFLQIFDETVVQAVSSLTRMAASNQKLMKRLEDANSKRSQELARQSDQETLRRENAKNRALAREGKIISLSTDNERYRQQHERLVNENGDLVAQLDAAIKSSRDLDEEFATLNDKLASVTHKRDYYQERTDHGTNTIRTLNKRQKALCKQYNDMKVESEEQGRRHWQEHKRIVAGLHLIREDEKRLLSDAEKEVIDAAGKPQSQSDQRRAPNLRNLFEALGTTSLNDAPASDQPSSVQENYENLQKHSKNQQALINAFKDKFESCARLFGNMINADPDSPNYEGEIERLSTQLSKELGVYPGKI